MDSLAYGKRSSARKDYDMGRCTVNDGDGMHTIENGVITEVRSAPDVVKEYEKCEVKGCRRPAPYALLSHDEGDRAICQECRDKYFPAYSETYSDVSTPLTKEERINVLFFELRQHMDVAREAKAINWGDDLFDHSIKSAERILSDLEELVG
jgi:hypothetical protein